MLSWRLIGALLILLYAGPSVALKSGDVLWVRVLGANVMQHPKFIGPTAGRVARGDKLSFSEAQGDWYHVKSATLSGWIHKSSVQDDPVRQLSTKGGSGGGASADEVELAGRGFTDAAASSDASSALDYRHIDAITKTHVDLDTLAAFATDGGLQGSQQ